MSASFLTGGCNPVQLPGSATCPAMEWREIQLSFPGLSR